MDQLHKLVPYNDLNLVPETKLPAIPYSPSQGGTGTKAGNIAGWESSASNAITPNPGRDFVPPSVSGTFLDNQGLSGTIGSFGAASVPGAAAWQNQLFNPGFNPGEQAFMQSMGDQINRQFLQPGMNAMNSQFSGTPFHSSYLNMGRELMENAGRNLGNVGLQAWQGRQGLAGNAASRIMGSPLAATQQGQQSASDLVGLTQGIMGSYFGLPMQIANQSPIYTPTILSGGGGSGKKG